MLSWLTAKTYSKEVKELRLQAEAKLKRDTMIAAMDESKERQILDSFRQEFQKYNMYESV